MSCKGRRASSRERIERFEWHDDGPLNVEREASLDRQASAERTAEREASAERPPAVDFAMLEREAFAKGFAQGERSGAEASSTRTDAMLRRLTNTLEELVNLRTEMIRKTERQVVQLAMSVASRIVQREVAMDRELLIAMARVALDRLGESASARIRLHPEDYAAVQRLGGDAVQAGSGIPGSTVQVVADPVIHRGGCVVESDFGLIDVSVDAQVEELTRALLADEDTLEPVPLMALAANAPHA